MANAKISALPAVTTPASTDEFAVNQSGTTKKETRAQIHTLESGETFDARNGTLLATAATFDGDIVQTASNNVFRTSSSDGSDNKTLRFGAGGAVGITRGATIILYGNEASQTGSYELYAGNVSGGDIVFFTGNAVKRMTINNAGNVLMTRVLLLTTVTTLADDATPTVAAGNLFKTGGTTTITDFDNGIVGQTIKILAAHSIKITDGGPIILAGGADYDMTDSDTLVLTMYDDQVWQEDSRSVN